MFAIVVTVEWEITGGVGRCPLSGLLESSLLGAGNLGDLECAELTKPCSGGSPAHCDNVTDLNAPEAEQQVNGRFHVFWDITEVSKAMNMVLCIFILVTTLDGICPQMETSPVKGHFLSM